MASQPGPFPPPPDDGSLSLWNPPSSPSTSTSGLTTQPQSESLPPLDQGTRASQASNPQPLSDNGRASESLAQLPGSIGYSFLASMLYSYLFSGRHLQAVKENDYDLRCPLPHAYRTNDVERKKAFEDLMAYIIDLACGVCSTTDCSLLIMAAPCEPVSADDPQPVTYLSRNIRSLGMPVAPLVAQIRDLFNSLNRVGARRFSQRQAAYAEACDGNPSMPSPPNASMPLELATSLLVGQHAQDRLNPYPTPGTHLNQQEVSASIRALGRLSGQTLTDSSTAGSQHPPDPEFSVEPDVVYGATGEDREEREKLDTMEKAAIDKLQLHEWELVDIENSDLDISVEQLTAVCQMVAHVPPRHWYGYLWCIFEDEAIAKEMLEKLRRVISHAKGYTTGPKAW